MPQGTYVTVKQDKLLIESPYNEQFINRLKAAVPRENRRWDDDLKTWFVDIGFKSTVIHLVRAHFHRKAYLVENAVVTDLITGETV